MVARLAERLKARNEARRVVICGDWHPPFDELERAARDLPACVYVFPVADTCKEIVDGIVVRTVPRASLAIAAGPWIFNGESLAQALSSVAGRESEIESLVVLCEISGLQVGVLPRP